MISLVNAKMHRLENSFLLICFIILSLHSKLMNTINRERRMLRKFPHWIQRHEVATGDFIDPNSHITFIVNLYCTI